MRRTFLMISFCVSLLALPATQAFSADAGSIQELSGNVLIVGADKTSRKAAPRDRIQSGDAITTEARSEVVIKMADDSVIALRPNTQFRFTDFKFEQRASDSAVMSIIRGTARLVSGLIGKANPSRIAISAATATIGIRGTDFEVSVIVEDTPDARAGVYDYVRDGATNIRIASGQSLEVGREQTAFAPDKPNPGEEPLQLLRERPIFLQQGGGLDALIQSIIIIPPPPPMIFR